jgi:hypothetical protein
MYAVISTMENDVAYSATKWIGVFFAGIKLFIVITVYFFLSTKQNAVAYNATKDNANFRVRNEGSCLYQQSGYYCQLNGVGHSNSTVKQKRGDG